MGHHSASGTVNPLFVDCSLTPPGGLDGPQELPALVDPILNIGD